MYRYCGVTSMDGKKREAFPLMVFGSGSFSMFPPALVTVGLVYLLSGRLRYIAVLSILTLYLVLAFTEELLEGMIQFPSWVLSLSIFHLYGNSIFLGMNWGNFLGMTFVGLALLTLGILQFRIANIGLG